MTEEYLDIVDENGNPTGEKELRSVVHEKGLWHQTVHIHLIRKKGAAIEFLVHLRAKHKAAEPNKWAMSFGGHVEAGDSIETTNKKELFEEIGIVPDLKKIILAKTLSYDGGNNKEYVYSFFYEFNGDDSELAFNDGEVQAVRWMTSENIKQEIEKSSDSWANSPSSYRAIMNTLPQQFK